MKFRNLRSGDIAVVDDNCRAWVMETIDERWEITNVLRSGTQFTLISRVQDVETPFRTPTELFLVLSGERFMLAGVPKHKFVGYTVRLIC